VRRKTVGEVKDYPNGTFCWIDLGTTDVPGAKAFYGGLFGWETEDMPPDDSGTYSIFRLDGKDIAGLHHHSPEEGTGWSSYISVDDADESTARAKELGAEVMMEPFDIEGASRMSLIKDPSGAVVSLWQPKGHIGAGLVNEVGTWSWDELVTPAADSAKAFYVDLFGWTTEDVAASIPRSIFSLGDLLIGGVHGPTPQEGDSPRWTVSFMVGDADDSAAKATELGGKILLPPIDIPIGRISIVSDPAGATFTIAAVPAGAARGVDAS
jgi:predicted enzyme related to lactoylglutathione lyase